jgi:hypothetical protein
MLSSAEFATARNLRIVEPYLLYYALFNSSRALFLMIPEQSWNDGGILDDPTHLKVQNVVCDYLRHLSPDVADRYQEISRRALATREMFSYKFPAEGLRGPFASIIPELDDVTEICQFVAEAAELHSECLQSAFRNLPEVELPNASEPLARFMEYEHKSLDTLIIDNEDWYRLWQFTRHSDKPISLHLTARPGLVEDFFGAWRSDGKSVGNIDQYDADRTDWRIIFDFT